MTESTTARADWEQRIGLPSDRTAADSGSLPAPTGLTAVAGTGHVLLTWDPVDDALGYLVYRADTADGPFQPHDHRGGDVLAVPHPPYADTQVEPGRSYWYRVASWSDTGPGEMSAPVVNGAAVAPLPHYAGAAESTTAPGTSGPPAAVRITVDAAAEPAPLPDVWQRMIGTEHLSLLTWGGPGPGGADVAAEFNTALGIMRDEIGVRTARAHGTFLPENVSVRPDGSFDFTGLDEVYDRFLATGLKPVVELSFMPAELAADPDYTIFQYRAIVSVPKSLDRWGELCRALVVHLRERYGADEVAGWEFEVWNEANLDVFWNGTQADYHRLYEVAARAVKGVDPRIRVGGPSSAAARWVGALLEHCRENDVPIDFVSTHTYGNAPLDFRPLTRWFADATGRPEPEILWTEWGVTPTHFHRVSDSVFAAPFVLRGMLAAMDSADCLAYWVASDHFEELGWAPRLFHGGFGLLTIGNLRKPRFWAVWLLSRLSGGRIRAAISGDGANALVQALASRTPDAGTVDVLAWNGTIDQTKIDGAAQLDRAVTLQLTGLAPGQRYDVTAQRVDQDHGNIQAVWERLGGGDWPDADQWAALRAADQLVTEQLGPVLADDDGTAGLEFTLPMPGIRAVRLTRTT